MYRVDSVTSVSSRCINLIQLNMASKTKVPGVAVNENMYRNRPTGFYWENIYFKSLYQISINICIK